MVKAVIFDRDGVLTNFDISAATTYFGALVPLPIDKLGLRWQEWGTAVGFPRTLEEERSFWYGFWQQLSQELNLPAAVQAELQQVEYWRFIRPYPDARPALQTAHDLNLQVGVLSNFSLASLRESLIAVGLADLVDVACAAPAIGVSKPHREAYLTVTNALGVRPEQCLFFDDEELCVNGARQVGMQAYLVDRECEQHNFAEGVVKDLTAVAVILHSKKFEETA